MPNPESYYACGAINDVPGSNKLVAYVRWRNMIDRAYDPYYTGNQEGVTICTEWLLFSNFREWFDLNAPIHINPTHPNNPHPYKPHPNHHPRSRNSLDLNKDIIMPGNKLYHPDRCCFVPRWVNSLVATPRASNTPLGVSKIPSGKYRAQTTHLGKRRRLGTHKTPEAAHSAYITAKIGYIKEAITLMTDIKVINGLNKHIELLNASIL